MMERGVQQKVRHHASCTNLSLTMDNGNGGAEVPPATNALHARLGHGRLFAAPTERASQKKGTSSCTFSSLKLKISK